MSSVQRLFQVLVLAYLGVLQNQQVGVVVLGQELEVQADALLATENRFDIGQRRILERSTREYS
jgi:hypothetical protein